MKEFGGILIFLGIVAIFFSLHESGTSGSFSETYNIGELNTRQNHVIISCFATLIGAICFIGNAIIEAISNTKTINNDSTLEAKQE